MGLIRVSSRYVQSDNNNKKTTKTKSVKPLRESTPNATQALRNYTIINSPNTPCYGFSHNSTNNDDDGRLSWAMGSLGLRFRRKNVFDEPLGAIPIVIKKYLQ